MKSSGRLSIYLFAALLAVILCQSVFAAPKQLPPGGEPLPDEVILAADLALDDYLAKLTVNVSGNTDPAGIVRGRTVKQGLVLVQKIYMKDLVNYQAWIDSLLLKNDSDMIKLIHKLREDAKPLNDAYEKMQWAARGFNPLTPGRSASAEKNSYDALLRDATYAEEHGNPERAVMLRQNAKESNWGTFLPFRERFYQALDQNPLLDYHLEKYLP